MFLGPGYGEMPQELSRIPEYIREKDASLITSISEMPNSSELWRKGHKISMCGLGAAMLTIEIARILKKTTGKLLKYAVGSDICDRGVVDQTGFASFTFL